MGSGEGICVDFVSPHANARRVVYGLAIGLPTLAFLGFLAWHARRSMVKLQRSRSQIMATYYGFLWLISLLNALRCAVQILETTKSAEVTWNVLWLVSRFGMILLEVSVVVFLLQGYISSGWTALVRTLALSAVIASIETVVKAIYIFALHVPLFLYAGSTVQDMTWLKWSYWLVHSLLFGIVYGIMLLLPYTKWRDVLPAKPSFYRYVAALFVVNLLGAIGALVIGSKATGGYCVYGLAMWLYYAGYPPLLYMTFLAEFFADDDLDLDMLYYSEMRDAGCFEDTELF